jgi:hypothetical protein
LNVKSFLNLFLVGVAYPLWNVVFAGEYEVQFLGIILETLQHGADVVILNNTIPKHSSRPPVPTGGDGNGIPLAVEDDHHITMVPPEVPTSEAVKGRGEDFAEGGGVFLAGGGSSDHGKHIILIRFKCQILF